MRLQEDHATLSELSSKLDIVTQRFDRQRPPLPHFVQGRWRLAIRTRRDHDRATHRSRHGSGFLPCVLVTGAVG